MKVTIYIQYDGKGPFYAQPGAMDYGDALTVINDTIMHPRNQPWTANIRTQLIPTPHNNCLPVNTAQVES